MEYYRRENLKHPVGKYQYIGKEEFDNGTEYYCLNTATGEVGVAFIPKDPKLVKADSFMCK